MSKEETTRPMPECARAAVVGLAIATGVLALAAPARARLDARQAAGGSTGPACRGTQIIREGRCVGAGRAARHIVALARQTMVENDLKAVILQVDVGSRTLVSTGLGRSMAGAPATRRMHFRIGSMALPYLTSLLLQLQDKGRLSINDRLSKWFPDLPNADRITLKMLANSTSGYADYVQGNPEFNDALLANVFRQWAENELLAYAFARPPACEPGTCFNYSHANFVILGRVLRKVTGESVARLMRRRILRPLGLRNTHISARPAIPGPALHAYS
jgi:D-alanyl-D-alanine carboxypeptidase